MAQKKKGKKSLQSQRASRKNGSRATKKITTLNNPSPKVQKSRKKQPKQPKQPTQLKQPKQIEQIERPKRSERPERPEQLEQLDPVHNRAYLKAFFGKYPSFNYDSSKPVMLEFYRMCDRFGWERDNREREKARDHFKNAMVQEFNSIYGTDDHSLAAWQNLCRVIKLADIPDELEACRQLVRSTHVNIVDLVDTRVTRTPVTHFPSEHALSAYTRTTGKYFPKENAYAGGLLRYLLRHIENPGMDPRRS
ncbi:hypothetical protein RSAG8_11720, partial [Rhizoctonia solani AG-8 WAC10335]